MLVIAVAPLIPLVVCCCSAAPARELLASAENAVSILEPDTESFCRVSQNRCSALIDKGRGNSVAEPFDLSLQLSWYSFSALCNLLNIACRYSKIWFSVHMRNFTLRCLGKSCKMVFYYPRVTLTRSFSAICVLHGNV